MGSIIFIRRAQTTQDCMNFISSTIGFLISIIFGKLTCDEARPMTIDHDQNSTIYCLCAADWKK